MHMIQLMKTKLLENLSAVSELPKELFKVQSSRPYPKSSKAWYSEGNKKKFKKQLGSKDRTWESLM